MTLKKHHAKQFPDADKVGDLIDSLAGGPTEAVETLSTLFRLNEARGKPATNGDSPPLAQ